MKENICQLIKRQTELGFRLSFFVVLSFMLGGLFTSCQDEIEQTLVPEYDSSLLASRAESTLSGTAGLVEGADGNWIAKHRIPLVGAGRVVNAQSNSLVDVGTFVVLSKNLVDLDLTNTFSPASVLGVDLLDNQIVSVKDLNKVYAGNQKAGFVIEKDAQGVLSLDVLKLFGLSTFLKGVKQETVAFKEGEGALLDLKLGNIAGGKGVTQLSVESTFSKPFDEIRLENGGVKVEALNAIKVFYAFVGETPRMPAVNNGNPYFKNPVTTPTGLDFTSYPSTELWKLVDDRLDHSLGFELLSGLLTLPLVTVDFGREIPAGSEVGYRVRSGSLLDLGVGNSVIVRALDEANNITDEHSHTQVVNLSLAKGAYTYFSLITTKPCRKLKIKFAGLKVKVGMTFIDYAYVREPVAIDGSSFLTLANTVVYTSNYRFADIKVDDKYEVSNVNYALVERPARATEAKIQHVAASDSLNGGWYLQNMNIRGDYKVAVTYTLKEKATGKVIEGKQMATVRRDKKKTSTCYSKLVNSAGEDIYVASVCNKFKFVGIGGEGITDSIQYLVDDKDETYIKCDKVSIDLIADEGFVRVMSKNGQTVPANLKITERNKFRVGFVINQNDYLLGTNVLKFLRIRLLDKDGNSLETAVGNTNNGITLGLGGVERGKVCLSIETDCKDFYGLELCNTGLLNISLGAELRVYYAFCQDAAEDCGSPGEDCLQMISNSSYGAVATYESPGLANIAGVNNLGNIIDNDIESYAEIVNVVNAASVRNIVVTFDELKGNQETGFIFSKAQGLDLELIKVMKIQVFKKNQLVCESSDSNTEGGLLNLKLAGVGDKTFMYITPPSNFDKLVLVIGGGVDANLGMFKVHGVYFRPTNEKGVTECVYDALDDVIHNLYVEPKDFCETNTTSFKVDGGEDNASYKLVFEKKVGEAGVLFLDTIPVTINGDGSLDLGANAGYVKSLEPGEYYVSIDKGDKREVNKISFFVHPLETEWEGTHSSDWNDWSNWSRGVPWKCSDVILPGKLARYPDLSSNEAYYCKNIHFEPGAELIKQTNLVYSGTATVDIDLPDGVYYLMTAPLKEMATGDMFVLEAGNKATWNTWRNAVQTNQVLGLDNQVAYTYDSHPHYFEAVNQSKDPQAKYNEHRVNPIIFQRFWSQMVRSESLSRAAQDGGLTGVSWSRTFNAVGEIYQSFQGFAIKIQSVGGTSMIHQLHFPKMNPVYHYYDINGADLGKDESVLRSEKGTHLMMDYRNKTSKITLSQNDMNEWFLFGNSMMAHINIKRFLEVNKNITGIHLFDGSGYVAVDRGASSKANVSTQIAPLQAAFLSVATPAQMLSIQLTDDMFEQKNAAQTTFGGKGKAPLFITAEVNGHTSNCSVYLSASSNDGYDVREDMLALANLEEKPEIVVYSLMDGRPLSIQQMSKLTALPLGIKMKDEGRDVRFKLNAQSEQWNNWKLVDLATGAEYPLNKEFVMKNVTSGNDRFVLQKNS